MFFWSTSNIYPYNIKIQQQQMLTKQLSSILNPRLTLKLTRSIFVQSFPTPNPNFLKFVPQNKQVLGKQGTLDISDVKFAQVSPLAKQLFKVDGIKRVFYGPDYISIAKIDNIPWESVRPEIYRIISDYFDNNLPIFTGQVAIDDGEIDPNDSETVQFIKQIIGSRIRPNLQQDGGDVKFIQFDEIQGKLVLKLMGACSSCPSSTVTLKNGIQKMITYYVPQVKQVVSQD